MKILGIIVLFYPKEEDVIKNILSYLDQIEKLILWDNTPGMRTVNILKTLSSDKLIRRGEGKNVGLGKAYNEAAKYALNNGFTHLLTMDQDSRFKDSSFVDYCEKVLDHPMSNNSIYSPNYMQFTGLTGSVSMRIKEIECCQSSGTLIPIKLFQQRIFFREELFAYGVDLDFCYQARKANVNIYSVEDVVLIHGAGYQKDKRKFLWKTVYPNEYPPLNTYLIIRNFFYLKKRGNAWKGKDFYKYYLFKRIVFILCYEKHKWQKYKAMILGFYDGITEHMDRKLNF